MEILKSNLIKQLFILAILIRLLIIPFYFHPDIKTYNFQSSFLKQGVFNIYDYLSVNKGGLPLKEEFVYFPLTYFFLGGYQYLLQPLLGPNFSGWLANPAEQAPTEIGVFRYIFILKLPYLFFDLAIAFLLVRFFKEEEQKRNIFLLWLFNPFSIALIYFFSNIDIVVVFLTLLSLLLARQEKLILSALLLGIGAAFKMYPLLLLPFLFLAGRTSKQRIGIIATTLCAFLFIVGPYIGSVSFREAALVSGLTTRLFQSAVSIGFAEVIILPITVITVMFFGGLMKGAISKEQLINYWAGTLLALFALMHYHIQWILWVIPFLLVMIVKDKTTLKLILPLLVIFLTIPLLYKDGFMTINLFIIDHQAYKLLPTPFFVIQRLYDPFIIQSILHSVLAGIGAFFIWRLFKEQNI